MGKSGAIGSQVWAAVHFILLTPSANGDLLYHVWLHFSPHWLDNLLPFMNESLEAQPSLGFSLIMWTPCCRRHGGSDSRHGGLPLLSLVTNYSWRAQCHIFPTAFIRQATVPGSAAVPRTLVERSMMVWPWPFFPQLCSFGHKVEITANGLSFPRSPSPWAVSLWFLFCPHWMVVFDVTQENAVG